MARSVWKGPFVDGYLLKKAEKVREGGRSEGRGGEGRRFSGERRESRGPRREEGTSRRRFGDA